MFEYMSQLSLGEQESIKKVIQDLFRQTCILKMKKDPETLVAKDNPKYQTCNRHRGFIEDYLQILGCELYHDSQEHIFRLVGDGVPLLRISLTTTKILLLMKMIYRDKMLGEGLSDSVTNWKEIRTYGRNTGLLDGKLNMGEWNEAFQLMKRHQIIEIAGAIGNIEDDTPIYIYSTINLYCQAKDINALLKQYKEETEDGKENVEDEGEEGIQTVMFD